MKIAVNARLLLPDRMEGIGWFAYETLRRMVAACPEHTFYFFFDRQYERKFVFAENVIPVVVSPPARHPLLWYIWFQWQLRRKLKALQADVFFSPENYMPLGTGIPSLIVMHDLAYEHFPETVPWLVRKYYRYFFPRAAKEAAAIVTVSEFSKQDIHEKYGVPLGKISVVHTGVNEAFHPVDERIRAEVRTRYANGQPYFFFVGGLYPRKNIGRLIEAFILFKEKTDLPHHLLIAGKKAYGADSWIRQAEESKFGRDIQFMGRIGNQEELNSLLAGAEALTYISLFEGFGMPCLEAMRCGTPVLTSHVSSLPEVCGDAALYVDPLSVESIAAGLEEMAGNKPLRDELALKGLARQAAFTWDNTADLLWKQIEKLGV